MKEPKYCFIVNTDFRSRKILKITEDLLAMALEEDFEYTTDKDTDRIIILYDNLNMCKRDRNRLNSLSTDMWHVLSRIHKVEIKGDNLHILEEI